MSVTPSQFDILRQTLDAAALRHRVISQNVANVNTPGYQAKQVSFEGLLKRALTNKQSLAEASPVVEATEGLVARIDGNNVDIDLEVAELNKNSIMYETYTQLLTTKLAMMRSAVTGR